MKKLLKVIFNLIVIMLVLSIIPIVMLIDVIQVHFAYYF